MSLQAFRIELLSILHLKHSSLLPSAEAQSILNDLQHAVHWLSTALCDFEIFMCTQASISMIKVAAVILTND
jgi:hypothetical protein